MKLKEAKIDFDKLEIYDTTGYGFSLLTTAYTMSKSDALLRYGDREVGDIENNFERKSTTVWVK